MENPKISVLIPMYNRKHYIAQCIDSVLNQTFQDFEIIIRDNCSSDGSYEFVAEKYAKQISEGKIKLLRNEENLGEFRNTNALVNEIQMARDMDRRFAQIDFFKDNEYIQYIAKAHLTAMLDNFHILRRKIYSNGITPELYHATKNVFKEKFGDDYFYPMFLFNNFNTACLNQRVDVIEFNHISPTT